MGAVNLIIKREFLTRIRKRSFFIMSLIGPVLIAMLFVIPAWIQKMEAESVKTIAVIDDTHLFHKTLKDQDNIQFIFLENFSLEKAQLVFRDAGYYAVLFIPKNIITASGRVTLHSNKTISSGVQFLIQKILESDIKNLRLHSNGVPLKKIILANQKITVTFEKWNDDGTSITEGLDLKIAMAIAFSALIYIFIFFFGNMVMRGVIEEKVNRIVEIIISSVNPVTLMIGKMIGIGLVALLQFVLWIVVAFSITYVFQVTIFADVVPTEFNPMAQTLGGEKIEQIKIGNEGLVEAINLFESIENINWSVMLGTFFILFIGGYLLYASLFAAIGSAVDSETDTQQFVMPLTVPLILTIVLIQVIIENPDGAVAFWLSIIPFTSPVALLARIPFGVPLWQFTLSIFLLVVSIYISIRFAAKVYRTGILMYGKKASWKEIIRWIRL